MDALVDRIAWGFGGFVVLGCAAASQLLPHDAVAANAFVAACGIAILMASRRGWFTRSHFPSDRPQMLGALCFFAACVCPLTGLATADVIATMLSATGLVLVYFGVSIAAER